MAFPPEKYLNIFWNLREGVKIGEIAQLKLSWVAKRSLCWLSSVEDKCQEIQIPDLQRLSWNTGPAFLSGAFKCFLSQIL